MSNTFRLGPDGIYRCDALQQFVWQSHGFGTRQGNPPVAVTLRQVHSDCVWNAAGLSDREQEGDALVTDEVGKSIGIRTADCIPILLLDSRNRAVGAVHAGWRGTASQISKRAIGKMISDFKTDPADIYAVMGPCIRACCYKVGAEVAEKFAAMFNEPQGTAGQPTVNLAEANRRQMESAGVLGSRIFDSQLCTNCDSTLFYSYRREPGNPGRMVASITRIA